MTPEQAKFLRDAARKRSKIMQAYRRGIPKAEIARRFAVSRQRIQSVIKREESKK